MTIKEHQLQILDETIKAYTRLTRCVENDGYANCMYHVEGKQGCAVGRLVSEDIRKTLAENQSASSNGVFCKLPKELQDLGREFLDAIQYLHDRYEHWDENGLTEEGTKYADRMRVKIKSDLY